MVPNRITRCPNASSNNGHRTILPANPFHAVTSVPCAYFKERAMSETDFDDLEMLDDPESDQHVRMNKRDVERLRTAAKETPKLRKELDGYKKTDAIRSAGLTDLTDSQITKLSKLVDDPTPENLRAEAEELGWVQAQAPDPEQQQIAAEVAAQTAAAANANGGAPPADRRVTNEKYDTWPVDKRMRFQENHPDLAEALMRDETIDAPAGFY